MIVCVLYCWQITASATCSWMYLQTVLNTRGQTMSRAQYMSRQICPADIHTRRDAMKLNWVRVFCWITLLMLKDSLLEKIGAKCNLFGVFSKNWSYGSPTRNKKYSLIGVQPHDFFQGGATKWHFFKNAPKNLSPLQPKISPQGGVQPQDFFSKTLPKNLTPCNQKSPPQEINLLHVILNFTTDL